MATRTVISTILRPDGAPWGGAVVAFSMVPSRYTATEHVPTIPTITATADADGRISQVLYAPATYYVTIAGVQRFRITLLADSTDPITLEELHAASAAASIPTDAVQTAIAAALAGLGLDDLADVAVVDPASGQVLARAGSDWVNITLDAVTAAQLSAALGDYALASNLAAEIVDRSDADAGLTSALNAEIAYRDLQVDSLFADLTAGDSANAAALATAAAALELVDSQLASDLADESAARSGADATLGASLDELGGNVVSHINNLNNPHGTTAAQVGADPTGTASTAIASHLAAGDPHPQYQTQAEGDARYGLLTAAFGPQLVTGNYYQASPIATATSTFTSNVGWIWLVPFFVARAFTMDRIAFEVTAAGSADVVITLGLYARDDATGKPGARVATFGTVSNPGVATHELTVSQAISPGWYYLAFLTTGTSTPTVRAAITPLISYLGSSTLSVGSNVGGYAVTGQSSLPSSALALTLAAGSFVPQLRYRVGALS